MLYIIVIFLEMFFFGVFVKYKFGFVNVINFVFSFFFVEYYLNLYVELVLVNMFLVFFSWCIRCFYIVDWLDVIVVN